MQSPFRHVAEKTQYIGKVRPGSGTLGSGTLGFLDGTRNLDL